MVLKINRTYHPDGTNGLLSYEGKPICQTIELPWRANQRNISCIPEGCYQLVRRHFNRHGLQLAVLNVPNRSAILIHAANVALTQLQGCIAPVSQCTAPGKGINSRLALQQLKAIAYPALDAGKPVVLHVSA